MQLVKDVDQVLSKEYIGGEIVLRNSAPGMNATQVRGKLLGVRVVNDKWISVELTCDEYTAGHSPSEQPMWNPSTGSVTHTLLHSSAHRVGSTLHFDSPTPQGTTAEVMHVAH